MLRQPRQKLTTNIMNDDNGILECHDLIVDNDVYESFYGLNRLSIGGWHKITRSDSGKIQVRYVLHKRFGIYSKGTILSTHALLGVKPNSKSTKRPSEWNVISKDCYNNKVRIIRPISLDTWLNNLTKPKQLVQPIKEKVVQVAVYAYQSPVVATNQSNIKSEYADLRGIGYSHSECMEWIAKNHNVY